MKMSGYMTSRCDLFRGGLAAHGQVEGPLESFVIPPKGSAELALFDPDSGMSEGMRLSPSLPLFERRLPV